MNYKDLCLKTIEIAKEAGQYIKNEKEKFKIDRIDQKGKNNFVTYVDKGAERIIIDGLKKILPTSGFIAEEGTETKKDDKYNWIIDPLDGTTNFIHGSPPVAVSIALSEKNKIVLGVVYELFLNECFYSWQNSEAYLNGKEIHVSKISNVQDALVATGFPHRNFDRAIPFMKSLDYFFNHTHGVRRLGSAATDLAYVACGRYDAFYEYNLYAWDVAAGAFIVEQAGGKIGDFKGGDNYLFGQEIVAANNNVYLEFLDNVGSFFNE